MMDRERFRKLQEVFDRAAAVPPSEQAAYVESACSGDAALAAEVLRMLEEDRSSDSLLDSDVAQVADNLLSHSLLDRGGEPLPQCGNYRLIRKLGEGGMGVVYLAERTDLGTEVAIKFLRDAWYSASLRERFTREQQTLAQLSHPLIARLYDAGISTDGTPWFVMEYVDGVPVTAYCQQQSSNLESCLKIFRSMCEAVQYAHEHAVVHRDLKPSNILVTQEGCVRLLDFGVAKHLAALPAPEGQHVDLTRTEVRFLTPAYAAPEQLLGESVGVFTDVYALGVILYELLTGKAPFDLADRTPGEMERIITETDPERPSSAGARRPPPNPIVASRRAWEDLDVLCLTAIQKDSSRRYRSVEALIRDIDHYLHNEPLAARPDSLSYRIGKFTSRNWRPLAASALAFAAIMALIAFYTVRLTYARNSAVAAAARTDRVQRFTVSLFKGDDSSAAPAESMRVLTLVDRGVQEAHALSRDPDIQAQLFLTLGGIYQKLGKFERAEPLLTSALALQRPHEGADRLPWSQTLIALGLLRLEQGRFAEAEKLVRQGRSGIEELRPPNKEAGVRAAVALGKVLEGRGDYPAATALLEQAVQLQAETTLPAVEAADNIKELGDVHYYAGRYRQSEVLVNRALALHRQLLGESHPLVAEDLIDLGALNNELGHEQEAEASYRKALAINEQWYGKESPNAASNLFMLATAVKNQGRYGEAEVMLRRALLTQERVYGPNHPHVANVMNALCDVALQRDQLDEAQACYEKVVAIFKASYGEEHSFVAVGLANLASVYLNKKDYGKAEQIFREVLVRYRRTLSPDNISIGVAEVKLGRTLTLEKRCAQATEHSQNGYNILIKQANPSLGFLQAARKDLGICYEAVGDHEKAVRYRAERAQFAR